MNAAWFSGRLRELREAAGLSRKSLAERAGLQSEAGIRDVEQGRRQPGWEMVVALCQALGVGCNAFLEEPAARAPARGGRPRKTVAPAQLQEKPALPPKKPARKRRSK